MPLILRLAPVKLWMLKGAISVMLKDFPAQIVNVGGLIIPLISISEQVWQIDSIKYKMCL